jgi:hypothetical protein
MMKIGAERKAVSKTEGNFVNLIHLSIDIIGLY